jgi:quercetin dioxygenase-like cupin family protein
MLKSVRPILLAAGLALAPSFGQAQESAVKLLPQDIPYKTVLVGYPQVATVYGDEKKAGFFVQRVKFAPGFKIMPHWHPDVERTVVVLSGTLYFAFGEKWDESKMNAYPAGTFFVEPPKSRSLRMGQGRPVEVQVQGIGPTGVTMVEQPKQ